MLAFNFLVLICHLFYLDMHFLFMLSCNLFMFSCNYIILICKLSILIYNLFMLTHNFWMLICNFYNVDMSPFLLWYVTYSCCATFSCWYAGYFIFFMLTCNWITPHININNLHGSILLIKLYYINKLHVHRNFNVECNKFASC